MNLYVVMVSFDVEREEKKTNSVLTRNTFVILICIPFSRSPPSFPCRRFLLLLLLLVLFSSNLNDCNGDDDMQRHRPFHLPTGKDILLHFLAKNKAQKIPGTFSES